MSTKYKINDYNELKETDNEILECILKEKERQNKNIELIASENFVSPSVLTSVGSILTNKYAEGYPNKRYYGGCEEVDKVEQIAINRVKELFGAEHANVQPHSGSSANFSVYSAILKAGDTVLGMDLNHGGHLTHGSPVNFSGNIYNFVHYGVSKETETIDYENVLKLAKEHKPKLIIAGASNYSRKIDFKKFREIADEVGAYYMVDMAHIAGLVACDLHQSPVPYADFITSTTHKTLRGPRGGLILCKEEFAKTIDKAIFPGTQGGPLVHSIAGKAVAFKEALSPEFKEYTKKVVANAKALSLALQEKGFDIVSNGTDNHLLTVKLDNKNITGKDLEKKLDECNITVNKNTIPFDKTSPFITSGIRIGTPACTTRGFGESEMKEIAECIYLVVEDYEKNKNLVIQKVNDITNRFPLYDFK